ncbi:MAG TPA: sigma-70 family RNA polymerase sigma factor [Pirellulaceae bacterium]|nr:sigma-70 family RNA polymerase sigma factor [Pirellulaceae bacterium]
MTADERALDASTVAALYVEHSDELRRFLIGVLRDPQLAADVLQATFVKLVERGGETRDDTRKAWLFQVAYREALAIRRRENVGDRVVRQAAWSRQPAASGVDESLLRRESIEAVQAAMHELPVEQQTVVRMRIYEEKTFAEIARELNIPLGTALARMHAALGKMKKRLGGSSS